MLNRTLDCYWGITYSSFASHNSTINNYLMSNKTLKPLMHKASSTFHQKFVDFEIINIAAIKTDLTIHFILNLYLIESPNITDSSSKIQTSHLLVYCTLLLIIFIILIISYTKYPYAASKIAIPAANQSEQSTQTKQNEPNIYHDLNIKFDFFKT